MKAVVFLAAVAALLAALGLQMSGISFLGPHTGGAVFLLAALALFCFAFNAPGGDKKQGMFTSTVLGILFLVFGVMQLAGVPSFVFKAAAVIFILFGLLTFMHGSNMEGDSVFGGVLNLGIILFLAGLITLFA